jgi:SAM-dependent methyltransferase
MNMATANRSAAPVAGALEAYYEQGELWELKRYSSDYDQQLRARVVASLIPADAANVLDVGCGSGFITRHIKAPRVVGLDPSSEALARFEGECVQGSADALPFGDVAFDTVVCTEVLEHLSKPVYARTLAELARVAGRHVLIGVPYRERLSGGLTRCAECGRVYHVSLHQRAFHSPNDVEKLFPGFVQQAAVLVGRRTVPSYPWFYWLRRRLVGLDLKSPFARCPHCGNAKTVTFRNKRLRRWLFDGLAWRLPRKVLPKWMLVLLTRIEE